MDNVGEKLANTCLDAVPHTAVITDDWQMLEEALNQLLTEGEDNVDQQPGNINKLGE